MSKVSEVAVVAHADKLAGRDRKRLKKALGDAGIDAPWFAVAKAKQAGAATRKALDGGATHRHRVRRRRHRPGRLRSARRHRWRRSPCCPPARPTSSPPATRCPPTRPTIVELIVTGRRRKIDSACCNEQTFNVMAGTGLRRGDDRRRRRPQGPPRNARLRPRGRAPRPCP